MLVSESRPRTLKWVHAGPLLYGDWGTSRLYVLGLAFLYTAHTSIIYLAAIGLLMLAVSWAYTIVCATSHMAVACTRRVARTPQY